MLAGPWVSRYCRAWGVAAGWWQPVRRYVVPTRAGWSSRCGRCRCGVRLQPSCKLHPQEPAWPHFVSSQHNRIKYVTLRTMYMDQTCDPSKFPFLPQQTCSSGLIFCAAIVAVPSSGWEKARCPVRVHLRTQRPATASLPMHEIVEVSYNH